MQVTKNSIIGVLVTLLMFLIGCGQAKQPPFKCDDPLGCVEIAPQESIKISALQVLSGEVKSLGIDQIRMAELAIGNRDGKLMGHPVELQKFDAMCSKEGGRTGAQRIVSDPKVVAIFGTTCSGAAAPAIQIISEVGYAMISGTNTAPSLTFVNGRKGQDHHPGYFRTAHNDEVQGRAAAAFAYKILKIKKAGTIHDEDTYTKGLAQVFQREFRRLGGTVVLDAAVNKGDTDMQPVLKAVAESGAQFVFFPLFQPEGDYIIKQARKMPAFKRIVLMSADGLLQHSFLESVAQDGIGMYFVGPAKPEGTAYDQIVAQYKKTYGEHPVGPLHAHGYDAANVLMNAIEQASVKDSGGALYIGRQALRNALQVTSGYQGLTGMINCNQFGDCNTPKINVVRLDDVNDGFEGLRANVQYTYTMANE